MSSLRTALALPVLLGTACLAPAPTPAPTAVVPGSAYNGEDTPIQVIGSSFYPAIAVEEGQDAGFQVRLLGPSPSTTPRDIVFVGQVDLDTLSAVVPRGLPLGTYDVVVEAPSGRAGVADDALEVVDTRVDGVVLTPDALTHEVLTSAQVDVSLVDADGEPVVDDLAVEATLTGLDGSAVDGSLAVEGLDDVVVISPTRVTGRLGDDGVAVLAPVLSTPGDARLVVRPTADDRVDEGSTSLAWTRGRDLAVRVTLPTSSFSVRAGTPFTAVLTLVDTFGNVADDAVALVAITDTCNSWGSAVRLAPSANVTVIPTVASPARCPVERLTVTGSGVIESRSDAFTVTAGSLAALEAEVLQDTVVAGREANLLVRPVDAYGNAATWTGEVVDVDDGGGGVAAFACELGSTYFCSVTLTRAALATRLEVLDDRGFRGTSNAFEVIAGDPAGLAVSVDPPVWFAGQTGTVEVDVVDAWGNVVTDAALDEASLVVEDDHGVVACESAAEGDGLLGCALFEAGADVLVVTSPGSPSLEGQADVDVVNGPLVAVDVLPLADTVVAGDELAVRLAGVDAYGNPWAYKTDPTVTVSSSAEAFPDLVTQIGFDGTALVDVTPTRSGYTEVVVRRGGVEVGRSAPVLVVPGPTSRLVLDLDEPWAWVDQPAVLRVEALDALGNRTDADGTVVVTADSGLADARIPLENGFGDGTITWRGWRLGDRLTATLDGVSGRLGPYSAFVACPAVDAPAVDASFGGASFARVCSDAEGRAVVSAQLTGAPAPGMSVTAWGLSVDDEATIGASAALDVAVLGDGPHPVRALVAQSDGCASELATTAWVGPRDGEPVGPLAVTVDRSDLDIVARPTTTVRVTGAVGCDGALVAGAEVRLRVDRGRLTGLAATGAGLAALTDASGSLAASLDVSVAVEGGATHVTAWREGGLAVGAASLTVRGDRNPPVVRAFSVEGATEDVSTAIVTFSERLDVASVLPGAVQVTGPWSVNANLRVIDVGRSIALDFDPPLPPVADGWQLAIQPSVRDLAGNGLAGTWTSVPQAWTGWFGTTRLVDPVRTCAVDRVAFRPDGDDGADRERDSARLSFTSDGLPVWWVLQVTDRAGTLVRSLQVPPTGASDSWTWDGRDDTGKVVAAGTYLLTVDAKGSRGNRGGACTREVDVDLVEVTP